MLVQEALAASSNQVGIPAKPDNPVSPGSPGKITVNQIDRSAFEGYFK
jgi:hypothetical protein